MAPEQKEVFMSHNPGWADARHVPATAWIEKYMAQAINKPTVFKSKTEMAKWHTTDWTRVNSDGAKAEGFDAAFAAVQESYGLFSEGFFHEPHFWICWENKSGEWEALSKAVVFADLPAGSGGEKVQTDLNGRKWDIGLPGVFHIWLIKDEDGPDGFKLKRSEVFCDRFPAIQEMAKRGLIKT